MIRINKLGMKKILFILIFLSWKGCLYSQVPPSLDNKWVINSSKSDEFNSTSLNTSKWDRLCNCPNLGMYAWGGGHFWDEANVVLDGNNVNFIVKDAVGDKYSSGGIRSKGSNYSYGYFEISAKLPGYFNGNTPIGRGFWPAFWTYYQELSGSCILVHDEIDILEPSGVQYADGKTNVVGWHDQIGNCLTDKIGAATYTHTSPLFTSYHKYAMEWLPDRLIFYFDDKPFFQRFNNNSFPSHTQFVVIDQQVDASVGVPYLNDAFLPDTMSVDYFRYYELNTSTCAQNISITTQSQFDNFNGFYNNIIIGTTSSSLSMISGQRKVIRNSGNVSIAGVFSIPLGATFSIINTPCY